MMANRRKRTIRLAWSALAAVTALILSACQQGQDPRHLSFQPNWHVMEMRGNVRVENDQGRLMTDLRPGDQVASNSRIVTSRSAHLIASSGDLQFRAGSNTAVTLPAVGSPASLLQSHGTMRVRFTAAADAIKRITTPHLIASGTNAVLDLRVDQQGTNMTITSGHIALSTSDGQYYARLVAGASARLGANTNGQLEIQQAAGLPFQPSKKLGATTTSDDVAAPKVTIAPTAERRVANHRDRRSEGPDELAVVPASQPLTIAAKPDPGRNHSSNAGGLEEPVLLPAASTDPAPFGLDGATRSVRLQQQFDNLTEDLLNNLPTLSIKASSTR